MKLVFSLLVEFIPSQRVDVSVFPATVIHDIMLPYMKMMFHWILKVEKRAPLSNCFNVSRHPELR